MKKHILVAAAAGLLLSGFNAQASSLTFNTWNFWDQSKSTTTALPSELVDGAPARTSFLGHSAQFLDTTGTKTIGADAYFLSPSAGHAQSDGYIYRVPGPVSDPQLGIGVCDSKTKAIVSGRLLTDCDRATDATQIDDTGNRDFLRLTLPSSSWIPVSVTISDIYANDKFKIYGSNSDTIDFDTATAMTFTPDIPITGIAPHTYVDQIFTFTGPANPFQYIFIIGSDYNAGDSFRVENFTGAIPEPGTLALLGLSLTIVGAVHRRRRRK